MHELEHALGVQAAARVRAREQSLRGAAALLAHASTADVHCSTVVGSRPRELSVADLRDLAHGIAVEYGLDASFKVQDRMFTVQFIRPIRPRTQVPS